MTTTAWDDQFAPEPVAPVRQPYDTASILRRNIADAEKEMQRQAERAESYAEAMRSLASYVGAGGYNADTVDAGVFEEKIRWGIGVIQDRLAGAIERELVARTSLIEARNDIQTWIDSRNEWMKRAEAAEAELEAVREDNHAMMLEIDGMRTELAKLREQEPVACVKYKATGGNVGLSWLAVPTGAFYPRDGEKLYVSPIHAPAVPDCQTCANRGQVNGLSQESYCDGCVYQGRSWRKNHFVLAVKRRCEACAILPCSCK